MSTGRRKFSPEADYGVAWHGPDGSEHPRWRVSYLVLTGEIYAHCQSHQNTTVIVLGVCPPDYDPLNLSQTTSYCLPYYETLNKILDGWSEEMHSPDGLDWIRQRLSNNKLDIVDES